MAGHRGLTIPGPTPASHTGGSIQRYDLATGKLTTIYDGCDGRRLVGPNDLVFDKAGGIWFTDHGCSTPEGRKYGGIYYAKTDGSHISRQRDHLISPNGIGLSPDETWSMPPTPSWGASGPSTWPSPGVLAPAPASRPAG